MDVIAVDLGDAAGRDRYDRLVGACPHAFIQQTAWWSDVLAGIGADMPIFLIAVEGHDVGGLPLYLFNGPYGSVLTSVPQAGPLGGVFCVEGAHRDRVYAALLGEARRIAAERDCLALTLITNPLIDDVDLYRQHLEPTVFFENFTQIVQIEDAVRDGRLIIVNNRRGNPAANIRKAESAGLTSRLCESDDEFAAWYEIHANRAGEIGAQPLAWPLVERIWSKLRPSGRAFLQLSVCGSEIAAGVLCILHREICDVFMPSMDSKFADVAPNYLAISAALIEMAKRGVKIMNWQSSPSRGDGVYRFKGLWGSIERPYFFVTRTFRPDEEILAIGQDGLRRGYADHFVVPFGVFAAGKIAGAFSKP